jgi:hypothetical protein
MNNLFNDGSFVLSFTTLLLGSIALLINKCYKSKCSEFSLLYNCIYIKRDIESEIKVDMKKENENKIEITSQN